MKFFQCACKCICPDIRKYVTSGARCALGLKRWSLIGAAKVDLSFDNVEAHVMLYLTNKVVPYKINLKITCKILSYKKLIQPYM